MKNKNKKPIIGILGGMGPQASACLVNILVEMSAKEFGAKNCDEFPEIILDSIPHPDFISSKKNSQIAVKMLKERIKKMEKMGVGVFAIACNTAHIRLNHLKNSSKIEFVSIIDEIVREVIISGIKKVGLLVSPTTLKSGLFQKAFKKDLSAIRQENVTIINPSKAQMRRLEVVYQACYCRRKEEI
ncbi:MAG: aspartate/glutamate racemase family protein [Candidatus Levyibacteriota bacterium]